LHPEAVAGEGGGKEDAGGGGAGGGFVGTGTQHLEQSWEQEGSMHAEGWQMKSHTSDGHVRAGGPTPASGSSADMSPCRSQ